VGTDEITVYTVLTTSETVEIAFSEKNYKARHRPVLDIGMLFTYRVEKGYVFSTLADGKEHRFRIVSASLN
jgi:hypothetical protein